ncbi:MAG TPA: helix-turn-helix domain-containing protein [Solirubrobacteraceae bacterium]|jgi:DNA-binding HxlR family transcriptional regulator
MLRNDYENQSCSIAGALEVVGERWSLLIVRDILLGLRRFDELQSDLGIARNVLQTRLTRLQEHGVIERVPYQQRPLRHEYLLTEKGLDLWPMIVALMKWGDRYAAPDGGPAVLIEHRGCGGAVDEHRICERCGARLKARDAIGRAGPGARPEHPLAVRERANPLPAASA